MSRMDDELSVPFVVEIAHTICDAHGEDSEGRKRRCRQCGPDGCEQHRWALDTIAVHRARRQAARAAADALRPAVGFGLDG